MFAANQCLTVVLDGHCAADPPQVGQQIVDACAGGQRDGLAVRGDGNQDGAAAAALAAAFFCIL